MAIVLQKVKEPGSHFLAFSKHHFTRLHPGTCFQSMPSFLFAFVQVPAPPFSPSSQKPKDDLFLYLYLSTFTPLFHDAKKKPQTIAHQHANLHLLISFHVGNYDDT